MDEELVRAIRRVIFFGSACVRMVEFGVLRMRGRHRIGRVDLKVIRRLGSQMYVDISDGRNASLSARRFEWNLCGALYLTGRRVESIIRYINDLRSSPSQFKDSCGPKVLVVSLSYPTMNSSWLGSGMNEESGRRSRMDCLHFLCFRPR